MIVFRDIIINWKGVDYKITPSMRLMRMIEKEGNLSFLNIGFQTGRGNVQFSEIAFVVEHLLKSAGANVTDLEIYHAVMNDMTAEQVRALTDAALSAFIPVDENGKNHAAPPQRKPGARAKR